jgi:4'-phosphopantetheinyl transferase
MEGMNPLLAPDERARAMRMPDLQQRLSWMAAHAVLRTLIGRYLDVDPADLLLVVGEHGKPALAEEPTGRSLSARPEPSAIGSRDATPLSFNISHSGELALYAFTRVGSVGVDIEIARRTIDRVAIAARAFGHEQARWIEQLDPCRQSREFLRMWTRHEAELKCRGTGFGGAGAGGITDGRRPGSAAGMADCQTDAPQAADPVWIAELELGPRAAGAVANLRRPAALQCWTWDGPVKAR